MSLLSQARTDTEKFIADWAETVSTKRVAITYGDDGIPVQTWDTNITSTTCDIQALAGRSLYEAIALKIESDHKIYFKYNEDILVKDRIYLSSDYYRVDYIKSYEDHLVAYAKKNGN